MKKITHLSCFLFVIGMFCGMSAQALTLGRLTVLSFLGQPLVAEIEVAEISPEEAGSLRVAIANADAFKSAGLDYSPVVADLKIAGRRRADGRAILEVRGAQPVNAPFVDLVLEITWNAGRMLRDYTILLDAPATPNQAPVIPSPTLPMVSSNVGETVVQAVTPPAAISDAPQPVQGGNGAPVASQVLSGFTVKTTPNEPAKAVALTAKSVQSGARNTITVKRGDTAAAIAAANKIDGVSLDQMLVAMLRGNPQAFDGNNVNRLKAGVVLELPKAEDVRSVKATEARNSIYAQARDFNDYRRKLASHATVNVDRQSSRNASGKVTAKVEDRQPASAVDGKLTLSKPSPLPKDAVVPEEKLAKERANADAAARSSELSKNISDLSKLTNNSPAASPAGTASSAQMTPPAVPVPSAGSSPTSSAASALTPAPQAAASTPVPPQMARPRPPLPEQSFLDQVLTNPWVLPVAGVSGLLVLLVALLAIRKRRAKSFNATRSSSEFSTTSGQSPTETVFGPVGASKVDTSQTGTENLSVESASAQSSAFAGDVDPIAEADVYLAYNRDVQAEEILKEAKRNNPNRSDVQVKLLEIYVKRHDMDAFNAQARELHQLTLGEGEDWSKARTLAREIGSTDALFKVAGSSFAVNDPLPVNQSPYSNGSLSFVPQPAPAAAMVPSTDVGAAASQTGTNLIDFDLSHLSLDLAAPAPSVQSAQSPSSAPEDPKLALAEEYLSIGDKHGARSLIEEVIVQNSHPASVAQAQAMLARLS